MYIDLHTIMEYMKKIEYEHGNQHKNKWNLLKANIRNAIIEEETHERDSDRDGSTHAH